MASVKIVDDKLEIALSITDQLLAFHGSFHIPLEHVTNAYVSDMENLQLQFMLLGTGLGIIKTAGIFTNPQGLIFCDLSGGGNCLVIETRGERFPRIAVQLAAGEDPNAVAHDIVTRLPDSGPVEG